MERSSLTDDTRNHYESLIGQVGEKYFYDRWMSNPIAKSQYFQTVKAIQMAFSFVPPNGHWLEIGSGPGTWTDLCLRLAKTLAVFDISSEFLKVMKQKYRDEKRLTDFICGDFIGDIALLDNRRFDTIFSARALEYMSNKVAMVKYCVDHLNSGGHLIIITKNPRWRDKQRSKIHSDDIHRDQIYWRELQDTFCNLGLQNVMVFPAAFGSYMPPLNNRFGTWLSTLLFGRMYRNPMTPMFDWITESYLIIGKAP
ncbi:MAG: class I SAM-dependent methyltransferase [Gammaproteobacteria bacterium]